MGRGAMADGNGCARGGISAIPATPEHPGRRAAALCGPESKERPSRTPLSEGGSGQHTRRLYPVRMTTVSLASSGARSQAAVSAVSQDNGSPGLPDRINRSAARVQAT